MNARVTAHPPKKTSDVQYDHMTLRSADKKQRQYVERMKFGTKKGLVANKAKPLPRRSAKSAETALTKNSKNSMLYSADFEEIEVEKDTHTVQPLKNSRTIARIEARTYAPPRDAEVEFQQEMEAEELDLARRLMQG